MNLQPIATSLSAADVATQFATDVTSVSDSRALVSTTAAASTRPSRLREITAPPVKRGSMTPVPWRGLTGLFKRSSAADAAPTQPKPLQASWEKLAAKRRLMLTTLMLCSAALATGVLMSTQGDVSDSPAFWVNDALFGLLFAWVCGGFLTAVMGYVSLRRGDELAPSPDTVAGHPIAPDARTAVIMPICNEDVRSVMAGLRATIESMSRAGHFDRFDVFVLSDTNKADVRDEEVAAWKQLKADLTADGYDASRVHYRWRQIRTRKKAGNVADFCRRWGREFRYMVVLDADSVMSGEALVTMVRLMEAHPRAGIIQTSPRSCGHDSLHARVQQFAGRLTGALFSAGLRYWQMGESHYWGHNAILRIEPFMKHCALAKLPGTGGLSGEILSHDFVEAALMRRAGYEVWLLPDLEGSYEQAPPHLIDELQRDRRWCQGNLQNARLISEPGIAKVHRAMFVAGAMSYAASPLWMSFVLLGLLPWVATRPVADGGIPTAAIALWVATLTMLLLPRLLAVLVTLQRGQAALYGGTRALLASAALESLMAALQAPVRMLAHSIFVIGALTGLKLQWKSPSREANAVGWREAVGRFGVGGAAAAAVLAWWLAGEPTNAWHVLPLALPLVLAVPLAVYTSRTDVGAAWRRRGWLLIPEEVQPPAVLRAAWRYAGRPVDATDAAVPASGSRAATAPRVNASSPSATNTGALTWRNRALATVGLAMAAGAMVLPGPVAHGGLSESDLAAIRIVMQASSPEAEPQVVAANRGVRVKRVSATSRDLVREQARRAATPI